MNIALLSLYSYIMLQIGELIEGIFKAGFWVAIVLITIIVVIGIWLYRKFTSNRRKGPDSGSDRL